MSSRSIDSTMELRNAARGAADADAMLKGDVKKQRVRDAVWSRFEKSGEALFPGARGRIPNFRGAAAAADRLAATPEWRRARVVKCNPDTPQRPVRLRALREAKVLYMAVP